MTKSRPSFSKYLSAMALAMALPLAPVTLHAQQGDNATAGGDSAPTASRSEKADELGLTTGSDGRILHDLEQQRLQALAHSQTEETEVVWLETNQESFLGLYIPAIAPKAKGGILLIHHDRTSADWPGAIKSLRQGLPDFGWHTLSIAIPDQPLLPVESTLAAEANGEEGKLLDAHYERISGRIQSALRYLESQQVNNFMILGVGSGGYWAARYASEFQQQRVFSLVMVDALKPQLEIKPGFVELMPKLKIPTLDLHHGSFGGQEPVEQLARIREREMRRQAGSNYTPFRIPHKASDWKRNDRRLVLIMNGLIAEKIETARRVMAKPNAAATDNGTQRPGG